MALVAILFLFATSSLAWAQEQKQEQPSFLTEVARNLFDSSGLMKLFERPEYTVAAIAVVNAIIFTETGLLIGFFLPGDSLLVTTGFIAYRADWPLLILMITVCLSAIIGDSVGYAIGWRTGPHIFCREKSFFFKKDHLLHAQRFYEKHGGKTIILARFIPILRTFAPVVAGVGKMNYRQFLFYNVFGGIGWVVSMIGLGYLIEPIFEAPLQAIFGPKFEVQDHVEKVIILVVLASISPGIIAWLRMKFAGKTPQPEAVAAVPEETVA